jgi:hypothetical protein
MSLTAQREERTSDLWVLLSWGMSVRQLLTLPPLGAFVLSALSGCDDRGYGGYYRGPQAEAQSYVGTTGEFAAWADPVSGYVAYAPIGSFAGKRQVLHGSRDFLSGADLRQPAGVEVYKDRDGHIYALDLTTVTEPSAVQISSEAAATVDDTCSLSGTQVAGANSDYAGVYFAADLQNPVNSAYFYRLPGADGECDTGDDVVHMVKTGMSAGAAPVTAPAMPVATVHTPQGGIAGFVVKSGATLVMLDGNLANPVVLGTFMAPVGVATALPVGTVQGYPTGQLYVVDGSIVYVNYAAHTTSAPLYSIPQWTPTNPAAAFAASPTTLYFAINTPAAAGASASASLYAMPADGTAAPTVVDVETGRIAALQYAVQASNLIFSVENPDYVLRALPAAGGPAVTLVSSGGNGGSFTATASTVYYTAWQSSTSSPHTVTHSGTLSGIVSVDGAVVQPPLANSAFAAGGEQFPWPNDTITTQTAYETVFQVQNLTPVTVTDTATGVTYIEDGVSGGELFAIDTASNQTVANVGMLPEGTATFLTGTFRRYDHTGFLEATTALSTQDPATRDLYLLNSRGTGSLIRATSNLP